MWLILTLAMTAGVVTFSVVDAVVFRPLPFPESDRLIAIEFRSDIASHVSTGPAYMYSVLSRELTAIYDIAAVTRDYEQLTHDGRTESVVSARITPELFATLRTWPERGRPTVADDSSDGRQNVAVISHSLWRRAFNSDAEIVGRWVVAGKRQVQIVGVMPQGFAYPLNDDRRPEMWTPLVISDAELMGKVLNRNLQIIGRLQRGTTVANANSELATVYARQLASGPPGLATIKPEIRPLKDTLSESARTWMLLVLAAVVVIGLLACANVAGLAIGRSERRAQEIAIRAAVGASRTRLVGTAILESALLAALATLASLLIAWWSVEAVRAFLPAGISRVRDIDVNLRVVSAAAMGAVGVTLLCGIVPALRLARVALVTQLSTGATRSAAGGDWRSKLLVAEIACVSFLLVAAVLFVASFIKIVTFDLGFDRRNVLLAERSGLRGTVAEVLGQLRALPQVSAAAGFSNGAAPLAMAGGFGGGQSGVSIAPPGNPADRMFVMSMLVTPEYFKTVGIRLVQGRDFVPEELGKTNAIVLDSSIAQRLFGSGRSPVGGAVEYGETSATVVGVVETVRDRGPEGKLASMVYLPTRLDANGHQWVVRTSGGARHEITRVQGALEQFGLPGRRPAQVRLLDDAFRAITANRRFAAQLMFGLGLTALLIGALGTFVTMLSRVNQRRREFGIRLALGASRANVTWMTFRRAVRDVVFGAAIGLPMALAASLGSRSLYFGVAPTDPIVYGIVVGLLVFVAVAAAAVPAFQAARTNPAVSFRLL